MTSKNPCAKTVTRENAYEVWQSPDGKTYFVLKKYQGTEEEAKDPYAKWFCNMVSGATGPRGQTGDVYVRDIKKYARKLSYNPATGKKIA